MNRVSRWRYAPVGVACLVRAGVAGCTSGATWTAPPVASAAPIPSPSIAPADACVTATLDAMSTAELAGQVLLVGTPVTNPDGIESAVKTYALGGVFLAGRSKRSAASLKRDIAAIQAAAPADDRLFIALDQEGGEVQTLQGADFPPIPTALAQVAATSTSATSAATPVAVATTDPADALPNWDGTGRVNILLLGSDTRGTDEVARSDTMILVTVNPATNQVSMLSIPRDLLVSIPNYGQGKINAAYAYGSQTEYTGAGLAVATVEFNFGVKIDYFAEVDTFGMASIIDTLGGVTLDVDAPIKDDEYPANGNNYMRVLFHTGLQHMDGTEAVQFARTRHDDNDFARGNRQQQLLRALQEQGIDLNLLSKARELLTELGNTFRTDLSPTQVLALAKLGAKITPDDIHSYDLLNATTVSYAPGQPYYLLPNWDAIHQILNEMMAK
jgi:LCP family protein required for cell wall assembly